MRKRRPSDDLRRRHRRVPVLWSASLDGGFEDEGCTIINVSVSGAKVRASDSAMCPPRVDLRSPRFGALKSRIVWRDGAFLGLEFLEQPAKIMGALGNVLGPVGPAEAAYA